MTAVIPCQAMLGHCRLRLWCATHRRSAAAPLVEQAVLDVQQAEEGMQQLLSGVAPGLQQQLRQDLQHAVELFSSTLQVRTPANSVPH